MSVTTLALALFAAASLPQPGATAVSTSANLNELAAKPLAAGQKEEAIAVLEKASAADPDDAAVLINLGIAYAQAGDEDKARAAFEAAIASRDVIELDTADGATTDSRRLARKALKMLERGEFRPADARGEQLTYRN